jgi:catechol 2,3-dioxygenase
LSPPPGRKAGAIAAAEAFYGQILGFDITCRYPGGSFFGAGGYHHQLATNVWNTRNAGPINEAAAGLAGFEILVQDAEWLSLIRQRSVTAVLSLEEADDGFALRDPWALPIVLKAK